VQIPGTIPAGVHCGASIWEAEDVNPQRRGSQPPRQPPGKAGRSSPPPNALFAEMLKAARELLAVRSPLDAELMVSELLGTWWGQRPGNGTGPGSGQGGQRVSRRRADVEELLGEGLVAYAAQQDTPAALALLSGIACLGTQRQAARAEEAALALMDRGVARPGWAEHVGAVAAQECYVNSDAYGDRDEVVCVYSYAGEEQHALVVVVDYNAGGMARDGWVTSQLEKLLDYCRDADGASLAPLEPQRARRLLESALAATEAATDPPVSSSFPSYHAFIRARVRTLPPPQARDGQAARGRGRSATRTASRSPDGRGRGGSSRKQPWRRDRRAALAAGFLASDEAEDLSDREAASRCADHIVDYGCDRDFGRPLRMSPAKAETFLLDWLPRKVMLSPAEQHAMPHVLAAWVRWAGAREGLAPDAIARSLDAVFDSMGTFTRVYRDPAAFGLDRELVARLLPDADLEALPRRAFAFPVLRGSYRGTDLGALDPSQPADRRRLLAADHDATSGTPAVDRHIDAHLDLADRLWRGDPPELWEAAQRLLDSGTDRHDVLHALIDVIQAVGRDDDQVAGALDELPPEEPG
jgi:hypothetical protein